MRDMYHNALLLKANKNVPAFTCGKFNEAAPRVCSHATDFYAMLLILLTSATQGNILG